MFLGGQALTAIIFIMMQNWLLGIIVVVLLAVQMAIIPRLRRPVLMLGRQRQITARQLAGRIAETADGVHEIHIHGAANYERADISERLGRIFKIRFDLYQKKFVAKFWNNILSQATPFADLPGRRLLRHHRPDGRRRRGRRAAGLQGPALADQGADRLGPAAPGRADQVRAGDRPVPARGHDAARSCRRSPTARRRRSAASWRWPAVTVSEDGRVKQLDSVSLVAADLQQARGDRRLELGQGRAGPGAGAARPCRAAARSSSTATTSSSCPSTCWARAPRMSAQETYLFPLSVRDNLLFGLKHPAGRAGQVRRRGQGGARAVLEGGRARRQSGARSRRRLDRLRAGRRHRPGRPAAAHGRGAEAGRARRGHLFARPARHDRSGAAARSRRDAS